MAYNTEKQSDIDHLLNNHSPCNKYQSELSWDDKIMGVDIIFHQARMAINFEIIFFAKIPIFNGNLHTATGKNCSRKNQAALAAKGREFSGWSWKCPDFRKTRTKICFFTKKSLLFAEISISVQKFRFCSKFS